MKSWQASADGASRNADQGKYCARLLQQFNITRAPVIERHVVVGMVSFDDIVLRGLTVDKENE